MKFQSAGWLARPAKLILFFALFYCGTCPSLLGADQACITQTLDNYLAPEYSCDLGVFTFSDFSFSSQAVSGEPALVAANQLYVIPVISEDYATYTLYLSGCGNIVTDSCDETVLYANEGEQAQYMFGFSVDPPPPLLGGSASLEGGDPVQLTTTFTPTDPPGPPTTIFLDDTCTKRCDENQSDPFPTPDSTVQVRSNLLILGPGSLDAFGVSLQDTPVGETPEPSGLVLSGLGLAAFSGAAWKKRFRS